VHKIDQLKIHEQNEIKAQFNLKNRIKELEEALKKSSTNEMDLKQLKDEYTSKQHLNDIERNRLIHEIDSLRLENLDLERKLRDVSLHNSIERKSYFFLFYLKKIKQNSLIEEKTYKRDGQIELMRTKTESLQSTLDEHINHLQAEKSNIKQMKLQIENLHLQDKSNMKLIAQLKAKINDLETSLHRSELKQNEIIVLNSELNESQQLANQKDAEIKSLKNEVKNLNSKLNEFERLKNIEEHIKLQRWEEFGTIAENMKLLTRSFADKTKPDENLLEN
jgi:hypothetical protein